MTNVYRTPYPRPVEPVPSLLDRIKSALIVWRRLRETPLERKRREMVEAVDKLSKTTDGQRILMNAICNARYKVSP